MMLFPLFWKFTAAQLQRDLHVIGEDVVEVLHPAVQWVPFRFQLQLKVIETVFKVENIGDG